MRHCLLALTLVAAMANASPAAAQSSDFRWSGTLAQGKTIEVRGVNGDVRAEASEDGAIHVVATRQAGRSDPESVRIEVVEHERGVSICAIYPTPERSRFQNTCRPGGGSVSVQNNDVRVNFVVRVPVGVRFIGSTVNGNVDGQALRSDVQAVTVNGWVKIQTTGFVSQVTTVNGDITLELSDLNAEFYANTVNGGIDSDFPILVTGRIDHGVVRGTIGSGGPDLRVTSVNGSIRLRRR